MSAIKAQLHEAEDALIYIGVPDYLARTLAWGLDAKGKQLKPYDLGVALNMALMCMKVPTTKRQRKEARRV